MREIKFRAYRKDPEPGDYDGMVYHAGTQEPLFNLVVFGDGTWTATLVTVDCEWFWCDKDNGFLMQFTGFYDKNGKEIWEGDVLLECGELRGEVKFHNGKFVLWYFPEDEYDEGKDFYDGPFNVEHEVVGNIYEELKK